MRETRKLKVGLAGLMCTPFRGDKESQYADSGAALHKLAAQLNFELHVVEQGMYSAENAQNAAAELAEWGADFILLQTSSFGAGEFVYAFTKLDAYLGIWAVPEGPPAAGGGLPLNSFTAANMYNSIIGNARTNYQKRVKWFYGRSDHPLFMQRFAITVRALTALVNLRESQVGLIGGVAPGFDNLIIDAQVLQARLGVGVIEVELGEVLQRADELDETAVSHTATTIRNQAAHFDETQQPALQKSGRIQLALTQLADEKGLDALAVSCWPQFQSDYHFAVCTVMGQMNDAGLIAACEGDITSAVSMLALKYMSNDSVVTLMDLVSLDETDNSALLWHCGPTAPSLADENGVCMQSLWLFDQPDGAAIGLHNDLVMKPGQATVMGFTTDFERILILDGTLDNTKPSYTGSRGWLTNLQLNGETITIPELTETIMASYFQHHYPVVYGNWVHESLELAAWLGVKVVEKRPYLPYLKP